ncbi:D-arabinono-1,4-lactone oxidase [Pseudophaeobacter arcticus]|jgi:FAD-linked oxidoreductase|uniref:D-arabinono-1,4-lactone oxidase n=1 Tax=Pseudophaeobacter arcticus TaxID=385492 RepID=UPI0039E54C5A
MWRNWSGCETSEAAVVAPRTIEQLRDVLAAPDKVLRPVGAGHSFTPLVTGGGRILDLSQIETPAVLTSKPGRARVNANARLHDLSAALQTRGQGFRNLGDINVQTLAGAMSTATHGTGCDLPSISAEMTGARLLSASGELVDIAAEDLPGVQVSLGLLGILLEIELNTVPAFNLRRRVGVRPFEVLLEQMHDNWAAHRCFEFFLLPHSGKGVQISHDVTEAAPSKSPLDLDALGLQVMKLASVLRHLHPKLQRGVLALMLKLQAEEDYVGESWQVLSSTRAMRFNEMEYHLPPEVAEPVLRDIIRLIETRHPDVWFPIEVRQTAGDTAWLSPFQHGRRISVAVHMHGGQDYTGFFRDCEAIFRSVGGRPHWGKLHSLQRRDLEELYPDLGKFDALRTRLDPKDRFLSPALARMFRP